MRTTILLVLALGLSSVARADDHAAYALALKQGRALAKHNSADAVAAFQRALVAQPDDPVALSELGLAAHAAKDEVLAEKSTRQAIAIASTQKNARAKAGALYNLALILEARGDKPGAVAALRESFANHELAVVRRKLRALDPAAADAIAPHVEVFAMDGPVPSLKPFAHSDPEVNSYPDSCNVERGDGVRKVRKNAAPFLEVRVFNTGDCSGNNRAHASTIIAVRLAAGWFTSTSGLVPDTCADCPYNSNSITIDELAVRDVLPGGAREAIVVYTEKYENLSRHGDHDAKDDEEWAHTSAIVIGIGPSGTPSITSPILKTEHDYVKNPEPDATSHTTKPSVDNHVSFVADGVLIKGDKHLLAFP